MELSVVLPCYNEEPNIAETVRAVSAWVRNRGIDGEIIVVNDGSTDGTAQVLEQLGTAVTVLKVVEHDTNRGYGAAVRSGCDAASKEFIAFMDADGQFDPQDFDRLLEYLGNVDVVVGRRLKRADPLKRRLMGKAFGALTFLLLGVWVRDVNCAMKVFRRSVWQRCRSRIATGGTFNAEFFHRLKRAGIPWKQVEVPHYPRRAGMQTGGSIRVVVRAVRELVQLRGVWGSE